MATASNRDHDLQGFEAQVQELATALRRARLRLVTAESCTGGLIAAACTSVAGSSDWFERGFVTYSNEAKSESLGVPAALIATHGAVGEPVARAMAEGALAHSRADLALAVTGIAGPGGATLGKPVGTVCFGWAQRDGASGSQRLHFAGDRGAVRAASVRFALGKLLELARVADTQPGR